MSIGHSLLLYEVPHPSFSMTYSPTIRLSLACAVLLVAGLPFWIVPAQAQPEDAPTQEEPVQVPDSVENGRWNVDLIGALSGSQAAHRNWQEGGLDAFALTSSLDGSAAHGSAHWLQAYELRLAFGLIQQDTLAVRKADDLIRLGGALRYVGTGVFRVLNPTLATGLRTQFAAGFDYDGDPFERERTPPVKVSDFFAPATLTQSLGLTYDAGDWFSERLSAASKETVVSIERLRPLYDVDSTRNVRFEAGVESVTSIDREVVTNVHVQSTLTLFKALIEPEQIDVIWEMIIAMQVNDWLSVNFDWVNLYDANRSDKIQIKERLSVGISIEIL